MNILVIELLLILDLQDDQLVNMLEHLLHLHKLEIHFILFDRWDSLLVCSSWGSLYRKRERRRRWGSMRERIDLLGFRGCLECRRLFLLLRDTLGFDQLLEYVLQIYSFLLAEWELDDPIPHDPQ